MTRIRRLNPAPALWSLVSALSGVLVAMAVYQLNGGVL